ncbi:CLUMA_CG014647, isoform A [Clunio marinus]|uniref:CLUMA_CG014647, isoform A n=1 Tax=Clunio marinus TaxID=568069 RepID=A0A1J1IPG4_9DIPT|nr:CLUMA_CG014647, isoform A [Clunio marinus]
MAFGLTSILRIHFPFNELPKPKLYLVPFFKWGFKKCLQLFMPYRWSPTKQPPTQQQQQNNHQR